MGKMQKNKGAQGERELAKILNEHLGTDAKRKLGQARSGGHDIEVSDKALLKFAIEVKRHEQLNVNAWWDQAIRQSDKADKIPCLAYRQNFKQWRFVLPLGMFQPGLDGPTARYRVEMDIEAFCTVVRERI